MQLAATGFPEADWEGLALERLAEPLGWRPKHGEDIVPGRNERESWSELLILPRLLAALQKFNPTVPLQYVKQALAAIIAPKSNDAITENQRISGQRLQAQLHRCGRPRRQRHHPPIQCRPRAKRLVSSQSGDVACWRLQAAIRSCAVLQRHARQRH